ncbi:uncharacterized protein si:ch211-130h14.4 [Gadus chalcogrammus]|uniref:uncharacterized protein si:ch211-130h14.4 n=1 Tax=Gadus chalcogrammus TaxID=1042646 RepID=UPI0024C4BD45|nr:uncharacterized protein si:ch211-130h14.4 [Gadus chalcogrammus]
MRSEGREVPSRSSVLPSILDSYASPAGFRKGKNEDNPRSRRSEVVRDDDDLNREANERRQALCERRHLESYRNVRRLRDALYRRYMDLLQKKVHSQRLEMQRRAEQHRSKPVKDIKWKKERLGFSRLQHDASYLEALPKTSFYLILELQNQLVQRGVLRTRLDLEDFGGRIDYHRGPQCIQDHLQEIRQKMIPEDPVAEWMAPGSPRSEESRPEHQPLYPRPEEQDSVRTPESGSGGSGAEPAFSSTLEQEAERMFPKMKVPRFAALQPGFGVNLESKVVEVLRFPDIPKKSRKAAMHQRHLRHMYDASLINMAVSRRLLDGERDTLGRPEAAASQEPVGSECVFQRLHSGEDREQQGIGPALPVPPHFSTFTQCSEPSNPLAPREKQDVLSKVQS